MRFPFWMPRMAWVRFPPFPMALLCYGVSGLMKLACLKRGDVGSKARAQIKSWVTENGAGNRHYSSPPPCYGEVEDPWPATLSPSQYHSKVSINSAKRRRWIEYTQAAQSDRRRIDADHKKLQYPAVITFIKSQTLGVSGATNYDFNCGNRSFFRGRAHPFPQLL
jgi:hypothetical protein